MNNDKWMTNLTLEELKNSILPKPHKPFEIDGFPVFLNTGKESLPEEIFEKHPDYDIEVSNLGRIKFNNDVLLQLPDTKQSSPYGYLLVRIKNKNYRVYTLVAETFCERLNKDVYRTVHHINNNGMDNRASNLIWVTKEQHREIHFSL